MVAEFQILNMIFEVLRITPELLYKYTTIQDQLLWLIFIPHIIIFLFLFSFGYWISPGHHGLRYLLTLAGYIVIVFTGWYGSLLVPIVNTFFIMLLVTAFIFFIVSKVIHPARGAALHNLFTSIGKRAGEAIVGEKRLRVANRKKVDGLIREKKALEKAIQDLQAEKGRFTEDREIAAEIARMRRKVAEIDGEIATYI